jgi:hypothetical protein
LSGGYAGCLFKGRYLINNTDDDVFDHDDSLYNHDRTHNIGNNDLDNNRNEDYNHDGVHNYC